MSGSWEGFWKDTGIAKQHTIEVKFCLDGRLLTGDEGVDGARDFKVKTGYINGYNFYFWQHFNDNGDRFLLTCSYNV